MVAAISQRTEMIDQVVTCESESIYKRLKNVIKVFQDKSTSHIDRKQSHHLATLIKQVTDNHIHVLRSTTLMFGTY